MPLIERTAHPRLGRNPSASERIRLYTPTLRELDLAKRTTRGGESQQLAFLVMLKSFQCLGYFLNPEDVPEAVVSHLRSRMGLADDIRAMSPSRSRQRYRDVIREYLGVKPFGEDARRLAAKVVAQAALTMADPADLINVAIEELAKERYELPAFSTLDRLGRHVRHAVNARLFARVDERISDGDKRSLDGLLQTGSHGRSNLNVLKAAPKSATKKNLSEMQERLVWLESIEDTGGVLEEIPNQKVANLIGPLDLRSLGQPAADSRCSRRGDFVRRGLGPGHRFSCVRCPAWSRGVARRNGGACGHRTVVRGSTGTLPGARPWYGAVLDPSTR